jgi:NRPS condensation-like uncharacterized protein
MEYKAEIFDLMQFLSEETGFNDHQVHAEIQLESGLDEKLLEKALKLTIEAIPILATKFVEENGRFTWRTLSEKEIERAFTTTNDLQVFGTERTLRIREEVGPQVRLCLWQGEHSALTFTMNHMVADGGGFKDYLYFFCETYANLVRGGHDAPRAISGDRGLEDFGRKYGLLAQMGALMSQRRDSNRTGTLTFPFGPDEEHRPMILTRTVRTETVAHLKAYSKARSSTINDAALAAYYRILAKHIGPAALGGLEVPVMIDLRRYLNGNRLSALRNMTSTTITRLKMREGEPFEETLATAKGLMDKLKNKNLGLGGYMKISLLFRLFGESVAVRLLRRSLRHPLLSMTNIGDIDAARLSFPDTKVVSAYICGSIKYKPHFQMALSGFNGSLTLSSNIYGSPADQKVIERFLAEVEQEFESLS